MTPNDLYELPMVWLDRKHGSLSIGQLAQRLRSVEEALAAMFEAYEGVYDMRMPHEHQSGKAKRAEQMARDALVCERKL